MDNKSLIINSLRDYAIHSELSQDEDVSSIQSRIEELLRQYKIGYDAINYRIRPAIICFEIIPEEGSHISKIRKFKDEMELSLSPLGVRIIAPVPGKGTVAIEFPRQNPRIVGLKQILESEEFNDESLCLPIACGIDTDNKPVVADLAKLPHLLISGTTGQGKSTFLDTLIVSLLYSKSPDDLKFLLIDPKMVEFSVYNKIKDKYLVNIKQCDEAVIVDPSEAVMALNGVVEEMDRRYCLLLNAKCNSIAQYNKTTNSKLPFIVVIVNEYADLMMTNGKEFEMPIIRLAQKSRAVGIHIVISTQRPSTNVITGAIKANFPGRIAFRTVQRTDSKVIIDCEGAEKLLGRGDMLYSCGGLPNRVQAPYVDYREISDICAAISSDNSTEAKPLTINAPKQDLANIDEMALDNLFDAAARLIIQAGEGRTSSLQRSFYIGYNRAGKIMDQLEAAGIIGPFIAGKPREALMTMDEYESLDFNAKASTPKANSQLDSLFTAVAIYVLGKGDEASISDIEKSFDISSIRAAKIVDQLEAEGVIGKATPTGPYACLVSVSELLKKYPLR